MSEDARDPAFAQLLKELRTARGMTQRTLARASGVGFPYISALERGRQNPPSEAVMRSIAEVLEADPDRLITAAGRLPTDLAAKLAHYETVKELRRTYMPAGVRQRGV